MRTTIRSTPTTTTRIGWASPMTREAAELACVQGDPVNYQPHPSVMPERGVIMRTNEKFAFVLYVGKTQVQGCRFEDLELAPP